MRRALRAKLFRLSGAMALLGGLVTAAPSAHASPLGAISALPNPPIHWIGGDATVGIGHDRGCTHVDVWGQNFTAHDTLVVTLWVGESSSPYSFPLHYAYPTASDGGTVHGIFASSFDVSAYTSVAPATTFFATVQDGFTAETGVLQC